MIAQDVRVAADRAGGHLEPAHVPHGLVENGEIVAAAEVPVTGTGQGVISDTATAAPRATTGQLTPTRMGRCYWTHAAQIPQGGLSMNGAPDDLYRTTT